MKTCRKCGEEKSLDEFSKHPGTSDGRNPRCRGCKNTQAKEHYAANRDRLLLRFKERNLNWRERQYGVSKEDFAAMVEEQNGMCLFGHELESSMKLVVDHCHETGKFRGIICSACNLALGFFREDLMRMQAAMDYLKLHHGGLPEG